MQSQIGTDKGDMPESFLVRWTKDDLRADVPRRLKAALKVAGSERAPLSRALLIRWIEDIEDRGAAQVNQTVARINDREPIYGRKKPAK